MDYQIGNEIISCLWRGDINAAIEATRSHLSQIDFDDDDDIEKVMDIAVSALKVEGGIELLKFLIESGFDINYKLIKKECLILKCANNFIAPEVFPALEELGADIYSENTDGDNVLLRCVEKDEKLAVFFVNNYDLSLLDHQSKFGLTPLMYAVINGEAELVKALIDKGSDVNAAGSEPEGKNSYWLKTDGLTPLALSLRCGKTEIAKMLLDAGADDKVIDGEGYPAVFSLVYYPFRFFEGSHFNSPVFKGKCDIIPLLSSLDTPDKRGYTVLMESFCDRRLTHLRTDPYTNIPISMALIENGADINAVANDGTTALHLAVRGSDEGLKALIKAGAELNARDNKGDTPLLIACRWESEKKVRLLLKAGADFNIKNNAGESAGELCAGRGFQDALELML